MTSQKSTEKMAEIHTFHNRSVEWKYGPPQFLHNLAHTDR